MDRLVIVGGGLAAAKAAEGLRAHGFQGHVLLVAAEHHLPYERPPLSKGLLLGTDELETAFPHSRKWYGEHEIDLRLGTVATEMDLDTHTVTTATDRITYDRLLIATGSEPRRLGMADDSGAPVAYLRTIEDSQRLKADLRPGRRVAIIGGGWIGLEVAAAARGAGCDVVVLEALDLPLLRVLGSEVAQVFRSLHEEHGVTVRTNVDITSVTAQEGRAVIALADGRAVSADLLVVGVGALPSTGLAERAGLATDNGILVDEHLRASHPDVFAAGDVANAFHPVLRRHLRVEHWDNAVEQGLTAARNMLDAGETYDRLPYFFTDQYDLGVEYVGHVEPAGYDDVILRGDVPARRFTSFWLKDGIVLAAMHANDWAEIEPIRRIVATGRVDLSRLRDADTPLDTLVDTTSPPGG
ncbi:NAD(P)/FAD-dependent oxidoreductase [Ornithinicoccus halotolerans]|uniref:NAD(P)/FAD-dependent oxidoreductase n=1 Tax=Ornithinicoccus halotolerans TaxID=1748220 RepID=UPI001294E462|nr:FAD-dependent oxidoreductase [Ornithinicoccus halotolerans]